MSQIQTQLASLSLQIEDMRKEKGKRTDIWCIRCRTEGHDKEHCPALSDYLAAGAPNPLRPTAAMPWCDVCRTRHRPG